MLNAVDVILRQLKVRDVAEVPGVHEGIGVAGVRQAQTVAELVGGHNEEVDSVGGAFREQLILVEMRVAILGEVGVGERPAWVEEKDVQDKIEV